MLMKLDSEANNLKQTRLGTTAGIIFPLSLLSEYDSNREKNAAYLCIAVVQVEMIGLWEAHTFKLCSKDPFEISAMTRSANLP